MIIIDDNKYYEMPNCFKKIRIIMNRNDYCRMIYRFHYDITYYFQK